MTRRVPSRGDRAAEGGLFLFPLVAMALLAGLACGTGRPEPIEITAHLAPADSLFGAVEVHGLSTARLRSPDTALLAVRAGQPGDSTLLPPLAGRYEVEEGVLRFLPRFRPAGGLELRVRLSADSVIARTFLLPAEGDIPSTTVVQAVYPSADTIPANHLRWYLEFSAPMREGEAERHVHLVDANGHEVDNAFLIVSEELWDPERRRLTLLFDPGRVKRGVRQNLESGAPLVAGRDYTLKVDSAWRDGRGVPLRAGFEKRFHVVEANRTRLEPAGWRIAVPPAGTRQPVAIDFGRALDRALAHRLVAVRAGEGSVAGVVRLEQGERVWQLTPAAPWAPRDYEVQISPVLEDPAGNRVGQVFDRDREEGEWREDEAGEAVIIRFRPVVPGDAPVGFQPAGLYILPPGPGSSVGRARD